MKDFHENLDSIFFIIRTYLISVSLDLFWQFGPFIFWPGGKDINKYGSGVMRKVMDIFAEKLGFWYVYFIAEQCKFGLKFNIFSIIN